MYGGRAARARLNRPAASRACPHRASDSKGGANDGRQPADQGDARADHGGGPRGTDMRLEPISKSPEEDNEASELYEAEEVLGVVFPTDEDAALPLNPSKEALTEPASHIAA